MTAKSIKGIPVIDQQGSASFVLDTSRSLAAKISSGHSGSEMESFLCEALVQRLETLEFRLGMTPEGCKPSVSTAFSKFKTNSWRDPM